MIRRFGKPALALASIVLVLGLVECVARAWVLVRHDGNWDLYNVWNSIYEAHPHSVLRPRPNGSFRIFGGRYLLRTDSNGFRSPEPLPVKPRDGFRIVLLGGSTTFNSGAPSNDETVALQTLRILREVRPGRTIEVVNAGVAGYTTMESLTTLVSRVLPLEPDLVVVYHGINDAVYRIRGPYRDDYWREPEPKHTIYDSWLYRTSLFYRFVHYKRMVHRHAPRPSSERLRANLRDHPPVGFERNLRSMIAIAGAHDFELVLCSFAYCPDEVPADGDDWKIVLEGVDQQNAVVERLAASSGTPLLDLASRFPRDRDLFTDPVHRNAEGLTVHARLLADFILEGGFLDTPLPARAAR